MRVVALAGGVGAGKFLRGLVRVVPPDDVTVLVNTGDDLRLHGLHISPDLDSVLYWLAGVADPERGWGRADETFRARDELGRIGGEAWFALGDLDLATHLFRGHLLSEGRTLSHATQALCRAFGVRARLVPMSDDPVATRIQAVDASGTALDLHFQEYWVARRGADEVKGIGYAGATAARPAPGAVEAIGEADAVLVCPSNPVASIAPILAVPGIAESVRARRDRSAGITPIVAGAPLRGMADRLMPAAGLEVSAYGAAAAYRGLVSAFLIDERDRSLVPRIQDELGMRVGMTDTIMDDDDDAERVARATLALIS
ncbi:MAG TPA: 2-phospho-L-lactate transferase [Actinomycetota bacterium]|jgi:LPPG:FO 2-phospho-L-lactate transferase|nr:2-phospho-L-lactate transferase [Actinomycetota bacterium]